MMCPACETRIENTLNVIDGVWAKASSSDGRVEVLMKTPVDEEVFRKAVNESGVYTLMKVEYRDAEQS